MLYLQSNFQKSSTNTVRFVTKKGGKAYEIYHLSTILTSFIQTHALLDLRLEGGKLSILYTYNLTL